MVEPEIAVCRIRKQIAPATSIRMALTSISTLVVLGSL